MTPPLDTKNREELLASMHHWQRELARAHKALSGPQRGREAAARMVSMAKATIARRSRQLAELPGPRRQALDFALSQVGTTEHPAGSNRGLRVDAYQAAFHMIGQPWCGAFAGYSAKHGGADVSDRIVYTPYIYEDALHSAHGLHRVVWHDQWSTLRVAHSADLVLFDFGSGGIKHVGMLRAPWKGSGPLLTVEGNTSFGNGGSQDNGGAVALRSRDISLVHSIVSIAW